MKKRIIKKSILASALLLMAMVTVLIGTSLAWFNVTVVNEGNIITSGELDVEFMVADDVNFTTNTQDLGSVTTPAFVFDTYAQPGDSVTRYLRVTNTGNINLDYEVAFSVDDGGLGPVIQIDVQGIEPAVAKQTFVGANITSHTFGHDGSGMDENDYEIYKITMTYDSSVQSGDGYEGKTFEMSLLLMAWQADYQDSRPVLVSDLAELQAAASSATKGDQIVINNDIDDNTATVAFTELVNLNLGGNTITLQEFSVTSNDVGYMEFDNGTLVVDTYTINTPNAELNHTAGFTVTATTSNITTSGSSYILNGKLVTNALTLSGNTKFKPQSGSQMSVSGTIVAPASSIVPQANAVIIIKDSATTAVDTTESGTDNVTVGANIVVEGESIQAAIDASEGNETIYVDQGTYVVPAGVEINKPNLSLVALGKVQIKYSDNPTDPSPYALSGISVVANMGIVTVDGFTVLGFENGVAQGMSQSAGTEFHVLNNIVYPGYKNGGAYMRNGIQVTGIGSRVKGNTVIGALLTEDWAGTAIHVLNAYDIIVEENIITDSFYDIGIGIMNYNSIEEVKNIIVRNNQISNAKEAFRISGSNSAQVVTNITFENNTIIGPANDSVWVYALNVQTITADNILLNNNTITWQSAWTKEVRISTTSAIATNVIIDNTGEEKTALVSQESELRDLLSSTGDPTITKVKLAPWYDFDLSSKLIIGRSVIFDGNGNTLTALVDFGTNNSTKHLLGINANNITVENLTLDSDSLAYGLQAYEVTGISLNNLTVVNSKGAGLTVNGATVTANSLYMSGNAWGSVNVDPGSGVTSPSSFTLTGGSLDDATQIWSDGANVTETATVTVSAVGYSIVYQDGNLKVWSNN